MPDALTEELIRQREDARDTKRQLGELAKVTGIQSNKSGTLKIIRKEYVINSRSVSGETLIWGNPSFGIWGTNKWGSSLTSSFETIRFASYPELINVNALLYQMLDEGYGSEIIDYSGKGNTGTVE